MTLRCRISEYGRQCGVYRQKPDREGTLLNDMTRPRRKYAVVLWDGNRTAQSYAWDFIELLPPNDVCVVDVSRAPTLKALVEETVERLKNVTHSEPDEVT